MLIKQILLFFNFLWTIHSYKILVVNPKIAYSHVNFFSQISDILTEAGNDVTVLTFNLDPTIKHPGAYKAKIIEVPSIKEVDDIFYSLLGNGMIWNISSNPLQQFKMMGKAIDALYNLSMNIFNDEELAEKLRNEKFDLGITETLNAFVTGNSMSLADFYYKTFGIPFPASFIPALNSPFNDKMTYTERFENLLSHYLLPKTPKIIEVSGIGIKDSQPFDDYWNKILSLRSKTVLVSFSTFTKAIYMPKDIKNGLLEVIRKMKDITFICKYEEPEDGTGKDIENLVINNWLLQSDLLNYERLPLFVTDGSMDNITELSFRGVPAVVIPVVGDQYRNAKLVERQNYSIIMDKSDLTNPNILIKNINTILEDETYKYNDKMVS
uniref:glucuronosyltransferase n=1 Tax=Strongyloides venezuelensis TaxID=75913 RepID=A0A0K0F3G7_STRVS